MQLHSPGGSSGQSQPQPTGFGNFGTSGRTAKTNRPSTLFPMANTVPSGNLKPSVQQSSSSGGLSALKGLYSGSGIFQASSLNPHSVTQTQAAHELSVLEATPAASPNPNMKVQLLPSHTTSMHFNLLKCHGKSSTQRPLRAHTCHVVDDGFLIFGGGSVSDCTNELLRFDPETMYWHSMTTFGDPPPPTRAHSSALTERYIVVFGGGSGSKYYNDVFLFDISTKIDKKCVD